MLKMYEELVERSKIRKDSAALSLAVFGLGINGEAGEVTELIKKSIRDDKSIDVVNLKKELGDVLWYVTAIGGEFNISLEEIIKENITKLKERYGV